MVLHLAVGLVPELLVLAMAWLVLEAKTVLQVRRSRSSARSRRRRSAGPLGLLELVLVLES